MTSLQCAESESLGQLVHQSDMGIGHLLTGSLDILAKFSATFTREITFVNYLFSCTQAPPKWKKTLLEVDRKTKPVEIKCIHVLLYMRADWKIVSLTYKILTFGRHFILITKTYLSKYTENFTINKWKFSDKKFWYFPYFCSKHRLWVLVRTALPRHF